MNKKATIVYEIIKNDLDSAGSILDFGCGKLTLLRNIAYENGEIKRLIGIDPNSEPFLKNIDPRIKFFRSSESVESDLTDVVIFQFVLHHMTKKEIEFSLNEAKRVLKKGGKLIVFEESFGNNPDLEESEKFLKERSVEMDKEMVGKFLKKCDLRKYLFLFSNDIKMNLNNLSYMPWTFNYKSMENWQKLFEKFGFEKKRSIFLGSIVGKKKQGMMAYMVFRKK